MSTDADPSRLPEGARSRVVAFIKSRRVDLTRSGDLVRFPLRSLPRREGRSSTHFEL